MSKKIDVDDDLIRKLAGIMDETGLTEIELGSETFSVRVARGTNTVVAASPPAALPNAQTPSKETGEMAQNITDHPGVVTSPMVGVAYTAADPGTPPFINVGDTVSEGQIVLLIEAMKVFNQIKAPKAGTVKTILIESGAPVEFGEPLLIIE